MSRSTLLLLESRRRLLLGIITCFSLLGHSLTAALSIDQTVRRADQCTSSPLFRRPTALYGISSNDREIVSSDRIQVLSSLLHERVACKKFQRYDGVIVSRNDTTITYASPADPTVVEQAMASLELSQRAPSSFNTQPYKVVMVQDAQIREKLAQYCLGPNRQRVLDADCTAVFLADRHVSRTFKQFTALTVKQQSANKKQPTNKDLFTLKFYVSLFSSAYPIRPRALSVIISYIVRTGMYFVNLFSSLPPFRYPVPSLGNAETWAVKQTSLLAMVYMLACTAQGLATVPMEGISARGIRKVIGAPSRYAVPLIIATGKSGTSNQSDTLRYPSQQVISLDKFA